MTMTYKSGWQDVAPCRRPMKGCMGMMFDPALFPLAIWSTKGATTFSGTHEAHSTYMWPIVYDYDQQKWMARCCTVKKANEGMHGNDVRPSTIPTGHLVNQGCHHFVWHP